MPDDRRDLIAQLKNRALIYLELYAVLAEELGAARAERLLAKAIERRGRSAGRALAQFAPGDFDGLCKAFLKGVPGEGALFSPEIRRCDAQGLEIQFHACPLKEAWEEAGLAADTRALLCRIAGRVDKGMFEAAGFVIDNRTWAPGAEGCCFLSIRRA